MKKYRRPFSCIQTVDLEPDLLVASFKIPLVQHDIKLPQEKQYFCPFVRETIGKPFYCAKFSQQMNDFSAAIKYYAENHISDLIRTTGDDCKDYDCPVYLLSKKYREAIKKLQGNEK